MARQKRQPCAQSDALGQKLGKTIQRLRMADKLSLGDLSEQSGVAKSMISQIERNETNPTLATLSRISLALGTSVEAVLSENDNSSPFYEKTNVKDTPILRSEDGLCELRIIGSIDTVQWVQWYDFKAKISGRLESSAHPAGSVENLSVLSGELAVTVDNERKHVKTGETLRYRADQDHIIENIGKTDAHATMVNILAHSIRNSS